MRFRALLPAALAMALLIPAPMTAQDALPGPVDPSAPALLVGTTRSGISRLLRIPLDGRNVPEVLMEQPHVSNAEPPAWSISPDGRAVLFIRDQGAEVFLVDLTNGEVALLRTAGPLDAVEQPPIWSADGYRVAIPGRHWTVVDVDTGATAGLTTDASPHGFDGDGRMVLVRQDERADGTPAWAFERWDPETPDVDPVAIPLDDAAVAIALPDPVSRPLRATVEEVHPSDERSGMGLRSLVDGSTARLPGLPDGWGEASFDPSGRYVLATIDGDPWIAGPDLPATRLLDIDRRSEWSVRPERARFSRDSSLLAFQRAYDDPMVMVHEVASGRTLFVPLPADAATATLVGVTGTDPLPLLAVAPSDVPIRPAEVTSGDILPGSPVVVSRRIDRAAVGSARLSVAFGRPASGSMVRTLDAHDFPIPLGSDQRPVETDIIAGPGPETITVTTGWADARRAWTWTLGEDPRPLHLPKPFRRATTLVWSPDGSTLAADLRYADTLVALWRPAQSRSWFRTVPARYRGGWIVRFVEGGRALLVTPGACSDECPGFPDHDLALPLDGGPGRLVRSDAWYAWDTEGPRLEVRQWSGDNDPVAIRLPRGLTTARSYATTAQILGPDLWVFAARGAEQLLLHYDRPWRSFRTPARLALPDEVQAISRLRPGWTRLHGESTLGCPARDGLARPGAGVFWVGSCRELAFTLP